MCLPMGMLKCYTTFGAIVTLIAGLGLLGVSIFGFTNSDLWISTTSGTKNAAMIMIIITDVLIILTACLGLYGIKKGKPCLLFLFTILVAIFCVVLLAGGIVSIKAPGVLTNDALMCNSTQDDPEYQWVTDVINLYSKTYVFCTIACPCDLKDLSAYNLFEQGIIGSAFPARGPNTQIQKCAFYTSQFNQNGSQNLTYMNALGAMEEKFQCTGWCSQAYSNDYLFPKFGDIHDPRPNGYCYPQLKKWVVKWSQIMAYSCFIVAGLLGLVLMFNMCICCHPDRRTKRISERFYDSSGNAGYHAY